MTPLGSIPEGGPGCGAEPRDMPTVLHPKARQVQVAVVAAPGQDEAALMAAQRRRGLLAPCLFQPDGRAVWALGAGQDVDVAIVVVARPGQHEAALMAAQRGPAWA